MSHTTLDAAPVVHGTITLPRQGLWHADLVLDARDAPTGAVTLRVGAKLTLKGTVLHANVFAGQVRVRVIGGAGRMGSTEVEPKWYVGSPRRVPLTDLLDAAGERLAPTTSAAFLDEVMTPGWTRLRGTVAAALARLTDGWSWRLLPDGTLWVGQESWPEASGMGDLVVLEEDVHRGRLVLATEAPELLPGQTLRGYRVSDIEITVEPERLRIEALLDRGTGTFLDRMKGALLAIVEGVVTRRTAYLGSHAGTVIRTDAAGFVEVKLDDPTRPGLTRVTLRGGEPGSERTVADGCRVLVSWEGGDPRRPIACPFDTGNLKKLKVKATDEIALDAALVTLDPVNGRGLACHGDMVAVTSGGQISLTFVGPLVGTVTGTACQIPGGTITGTITYVTASHGTIVTHSKNKG